MSWPHIVLSGFAMVCAAPAAAHSASALRSPWTWDEWTTVPLALTAALYGLGLGRLWRSARPGAGIRAWQASCFGIGWLSLSLALVSPLHVLGGALFWVHMVQHELIMLIAAPLLVLGAPLTAFMWALPQASRRAAGGLAKKRSWRSAWRTVTHPLTAWAIAAAALWIWHAPRLYDAAVRDEWIHIAQHGTFLVSALLLWWALFHGMSGAQAYGAALLYVFTTAIHSSVLGALLTFARSPWYGAYQETTPDFGLNPLEDQQLGGLIMWVPGGVIYVIVGLVLLSRWLTEAERRVRRREQRGTMRSKFEGAK